MGGIAEWGIRNVEWGMTTDREMRRETGSEASAECRNRGRGGFRQAQASTADGRMGTDGREPRMGRDSSRRIRLGINL